MRDSYMRTGQGFVMTYSVISRQSFDEISNSFREQILRVKDADRVPMVLCGNKCDLESQRQVSKAEGEEMAKQWGSPFYETSALARINVEEAFYDLVREIRKDLNTRGGTKSYKRQRGGCNLL
uniref:Uncharacterized protein n=1 Tax=Arcella intermedia TaxID=1963864 RepID=A0A6B2LK05_9EUKA